jgi:hypothetical protein
MFHFAGFPDSRKRAAIPESRKNTEVKQFDCEMTGEAALPASIITLFTTFHWFAFPFSPLCSVMAFQ